VTPPRFIRRFVRREVSGSPVLGAGEDGIRVHATTPLWSDAGELVLPIFLAWSFPQPFFASFQDLPRAVAVYLDDPGAGVALALRLVDPHVLEDPPAGPNFHGNEARWGNPDARASGWASTLLEARLPARETPPTLFLRAALHGHVSNVLALDLAADTIESTLGGRPHALDVADLSPR